MELMTNRQAAAAIKHLDAKNLFIVSLIGSVAKQGQQAGSMYKEAFQQNLPITRRDYDNHYSDHV
jgi:hypothetical protein